MKYIVRFIFKVIATPFVLAFILLQFIWFVILILWHFNYEEAWGDHCGYDYTMARTDKYGSTIFYNYNTVLHAIWDIKRKND